MRPQTARLTVESFEDAHADGLHAIDSPSDADIGSGTAETPEQTRAMIGRVRSAWARRGDGWLALREVPA